MRLKKQKRHRKIVRFYTACFGFRQPFKVLCDGTFVHHLLVNHISPPDNAVSTILGAPVKLLTTRCVLAELKSLGDSYSESWKAAGKLFIARCDHKRRKSAEACFIDIIGENNPEHFFVATQDFDLRKKSQEVPGVPVLFGLRNALLLESPSALQRQIVKSSEEKRLHMTDLDHKLLSDRQKNGLTSKETEDSSDENEALENQNSGLQAATKANRAKRKMIVKDRVQFKRNKAKGPNPLSCKKKKQRQPNIAMEKEEKDAGKTVRNSRKRKRSRKGKKLP